MRFVFLSALAVLAVSASALAADKIALKDGREFEGEVTVKGDVYTVTAGDKLYQFNRAEVKALNGEELKEEAVKKMREDNPVIKVVTTQGEMTFELFEHKVPNTTANVISLAEKGFFKGMRFHRIIAGFMAQGGCPNSKHGASGVPGTGGPGYRFADEFDPGLKHSVPGILSMANSGPRTNGSQFFICFKATPWLDGKHTVFGQILTGQDVLKKLEGFGTPSGKPSKMVGFDIRVVSKQDHPYEVKKL